MVLVDILIVSYQRERGIVFDSDVASLTSHNIVLKFLNVIQGWDQAKNIMIKVYLIIFLNKKEEIENTCRCLVVLCSPFFFLSV